MKLFLIFISLFSTTAFSQENLNPAQKQGACYALCSRQNPAASCAQAGSAKFEKYNQQFQKYQPSCNKPNATFGELKSCMISAGLPKDAADFMFAYGTQSSLIRKNNLSNYDMGILAMDVCK